MSLLAASRHRDVATAVAVWWISGGVFGLLSLANYYCAPSVPAAWNGGMDAVAALPSWAEVMERHPANRDRILAQDPQEFLATMERWMAAYCSCTGELVPGLPDDDARRLDLPALCSAAVPPTTTTRVRRPSSSRRCSRARNSSNRHGRHRVDRSGARPLAGLRAVAAPGAAAGGLGERDADLTPALSSWRSRARTGQGATVDIGASVCGGRVDVRIEDRGPGIDRHWCEELFERSATSGDRGGEDLGLYVGRHLMRAQHGDLRAEHRPGGGATFVLTLPAAEAPRSAPGEQAPTVLIVEDHTLLADGLAAAFRAEGLVVHVVNGPSCDAIVAVARDIEPDLVLLDLMLGDEIGLTIPMIPGLRSTGADVLVLTGITDRLLLSATLEAGASGFASKSATFDGILERVRNTLDGQPAISEPDRADMLADLREHRAERQARIAPFERLTTRERAVLGALMDGCSAERIADDSFVSIATVRSQIRSILEKLGVRSQLAAVALAHHAEWTPYADSTGAVGLQERADGPSASRM